MKKELTFALNYALNKGFQIHPDAFKILENLDVKKLEKIIKEIVREKTKQKLFQINQDDLETYLGIKEDPTLQSEIKVLSDPTTKITTGEGVKGYNALFSSRFNKLKRIISDRPESRMLKSIASVKTTKPEADMYLCGLVTSRTTERNITKLELEDPSGSFEGIVFDNELQKTVGTLLIDQFVMVRVGLILSKNDAIFTNRNIIKVVNLLDNAIKRGFMGGMKFTDYFMSAIQGRAKSQYVIDFKTIVKNLRKTMVNVWEEILEVVKDDKKDKEMRKDLASNAGKSLALAIKMVEKYFAGGLDDPNAKFKSTKGNYHPYDNITNYKELMANEAEKL